MNPHPIFVSLGTAAALLDIQPGEFRYLRSAGLLPAPYVIALHERYYVSELVAAFKEKR